MRVFHSQAASVTNSLHLSFERPSLDNSHFAMACSFLRIWTRLLALSFFASAHAKWSWGDGAFSALAYLYSTEKQYCSCIKDRYRSLSTPANACALQYVYLAWHYRNPQL